MLKKYALVVAIVYTVVITILSFISLKGAPDLGFDFADKLIHFAIYFLLSLFWFYYFEIIKIQNALFKAVALAIIYGILIEVLQEELTDFRQFDYYDIVANTIGALLIVPFIKLLKSYVKK